MTRDDPINLASARGVRVGLAVSRYHGEITAALRDGAVEAFRAAGGTAGDLAECAAPGAFELPVLCRALVVQAGVEAVVALGCVVTGETTHDRYIGDAVAQGLVRLALETGVPAAFGVLTCRTLEQARARAGGAKGNKGAEAMHAALGAVAAIRGLRAPAEAG